MNGPARIWPRLGLIPQVKDARFAETLVAQADAVEGRIFAAREPSRAAAALTRALSYYERETPAWVPGLRLVLARAQAARGLDDEAEAQLIAGIRLLESQRLQLQDARLQASFFDQGASLFDEAVAFQIDRRHDPASALSFVERGRARQLLDPPSTEDSVAGRREDGPNGAPPRARELQRHLQAGIALVYYECLPDRLLSWVVTREDIHFGEQALDKDDLRQEVAAHQAAMEGRAALSVVRQQTASLFDRLIRPLNSHLRGQRALILVPDETLQPVAFASLWDREAGRFLIEDHLIGVAPSGSVFIRATAATSAPSRNGKLPLLAVGNPRIDRERWGGLPSLPAAESEAGEVARLYEHATLLTGREATKSRFLESARTSVSCTTPATPSQTTRPSSRDFSWRPTRAAPIREFSTWEVSGNALPRTRLVVLAACRTAAGVVSRREGALSLARPFLAAGVPNVIASLWDVDDALSRRFFVAFHRALLADGEPLSALASSPAPSCARADSDAGASGGLGRASGAWAAWTLGRADARRDEARTPDGPSVTAGASCFLVSTGPHSAGPAEGHGHGYRSDSGFHGIVRVGHGRRPGAWAGSAGGHEGPRRGRWRRASGPRSDARGEPQQPGERRDQPPDRVLTAGRGVVGGGSRSDRGRQIGVWDLTGSDVRIRVQGRPSRSPTCRRRQESVFVAGAAPRRQRSGGVARPSVRGRHGALAGDGRIDPSLIGGEADENRLPRAVARPIHLDGGRLDAAIPSQAAYRDDVFEFRAAGSDPRGFGRR